MISQWKASGLMWKVEAFRYVPLSADHRVTDGALGARFLAELRKFLENPVSLLA